MSKAEKGVLQPMKTFGYEWKIERFFADCEKMGHSYTSPVFSILYHNKVTKWHLKVYPKGAREDCKDYTGLYLRFNNENVSDEVTVYLQFSIVSVVSEQDSLGSVARYAKLFKYPTNSWGSPRFIKQNLIRDVKSGALIDDTLTIHCEIIFCQQGVTEKLKDYDNLLDNISIGFADYETLLESNSFSDVTFNVQDNKMHLHKAILMCRNPVFKATFEQEEGPRKKKQKLSNVVEITDVAYEVMKEVFRFIYSGKVENIDQIAMDLLIAADKYAIPELKALCEKTLYHSLTVDNAIEYLKLTGVCDTIHLKTLIMEFIAAHCKEIVKKPGFIDLDKQVMHQIIQLMTEKD